MRSLTLPVGFPPSNLAKRRTPGLGLQCFNSTSGVLPIMSIRYEWCTTEIVRPPIRGGRHGTIGPIGSGELERPYSMLKTRTTVRSATDTWTSQAATDDRRFDVSL